MRMRWAARAGLASALLLLAMGATALAAPRGAATIDVTIKNFVYTPRVVTIDPGDTIRWTNQDSASHSSVSIAPGFATLVLAQDQTTMTTFNVPGTFDYVCGIHGVSMRGTVVVRGTPPATPEPSVELGHIVQDIFQEARPDVFVKGVLGGSPFLYATAVLALIVLVRFVRVWRQR